jgi:hypothetical protein
MLIETPAKLNDVVTVKMVGGDEVLGRLHDERTDDYIELNKPLLVMMAQQGFGLVPYMLTAGPEAIIKIDRKHVVAFTKTFEDVAKAYIKQTTSLIT